MNKMDLRVQMERTNGKWMTVVAYSHPELMTETAVRDAKDLQALGYCTRVVLKRTVLYGGCSEPEDD